MKNVMLKKEFRGLEKGTELGYDEKLDAWVYEASEEEIADSSVRNHRTMVRFSDEFVRNRNDIFDYPVEEKGEATGEATDEQMINYLTSEIERLQKAIASLKK